MSHENAEIVRRTGEALNRGDLDAWAEFFDPDVVYYDQSNVDTPSVLRGREQLRAVVESFAAELADIRADIELIEAGERVISVTTWRGTGRASGAAIEYREFIVFTVSEGRITEGRAFAERAEALEAVGLRD